MNGSRERLRRAVEAQRLVHAHVRPTRAAAMIEPAQALTHHRPIPAHRRAHVPGLAAQDRASALRLHELRQAALHFIGELGRQRFIRIQRQDPVVTRLRAGEIALRPEAQPVLVYDACTVARGDLLCSVGAAGVDHEFFRGERHAVEAASDDRRLVACDDDQGEREGGRRPACT